MSACKQGDGLQANVNLTRSHLVRLARIAARSKDPASKYVRSLESEKENLAEAIRQLKYHQDHCTVCPNRNE